MRNCFLALFNKRGVLVNKLIDVTSRTLVAELSRSTVTVLPTLKRQSLFIRMDSRSESGMTIVFLTQNRVR